MKKALPVTQGGFRGESLLVSSHPSDSVWFGSRALLPLPEAGHRWGHLLPAQIAGRAKDCNHCCECWCNSTVTPFVSSCRTESPRRTLTSSRPGCCSAPAPRPRCRSACLVLLSSPRAPRLACSAARLEPSQLHFSAGLHNPARASCGWACGLVGLKTGLGAEGT